MGRILRTSAFNPHPIIFKGITPLVFITPTGIRGDALWVAPQIKKGKPDPLRVKAGLSSAGGFDFGDWSERFELNTYKRSIHMVMDESKLEKLNTADQELALAEQVFAHAATRLYNAAKKREEAYYEVCKSSPKVSRDDITGLRDAAVTISIDTVAVWPSAERSGKLGITPRDTEHEISEES